MQCTFILYALTTTPFSPRNQPSRELDFCGWVGGWWPKTALIMLKNALKILQICGKWAAFSHSCSPRSSVLAQIYHTYAIACFCVSS